MIKKVTILLFTIIMSFLVLSCDFLSSTQTTTTSTTADTTILTTTEATTTEFTWQVDDTYAFMVYEWIKMRQMENGLHTSTEDGVMLSLYDNALAALVYIMYEDYERAELMFDFFQSKMDTELNDEYGGFAQFMDLEGNIFGGGIGKRWVGDNAWLLIAINAYHYQTGTDSYYDLAEGIENWIRSLQQENGSILSGYDEGGNMMDPITEGMVDCYNAVLGYDQFHIDLLSYLETERYDATNNVLVSWPENPAYKYAIDLSSWAYLAMNGMPFSVIVFADSKFFMTDRDVVGYCIDEDLDAIWPEHTLQMATAYIIAGKDHYSYARMILENMEKLMINSTANPGLKGLPYASSQATMYGQWPLWEGVDTDIYMSSSAWYLFASFGFNPFEAGLQDKEPEEVLDNLFYNK